MTIHSDTTESDHFVIFSRGSKANCKMARDSTTFTCTAVSYVGGRLEIS